MTALFPNPAFWLIESVIGTFWGWWSHFLYFLQNMLWFSRRSFIAQMLLYVS